MAVDTGVPNQERNSETFDSPLQGTYGGNSHQGEASLLDVLIILAARKWLILKIAGVFTLAGVVVALVLPKKFTATSTVMPPAENSSLGSMLESQLGGLGGLVALVGGHTNLLKNPNDQYVAMFKSQTVEDATIQEFGLQHEYKTRRLSDTRKVFRRHFKVEGSSKDGFLHVSVTDKNPEQAARMANGWVDQFRKLSQRLAVSEASQRRKFFEGQLLQAKNNLAGAEEDLKTTQEKTGMIQLNSQAQALIESAAVLRAQVVAREVQLKALETYATHQNAQVVEVEEELSSLRSQLARLGGNSSVSSAGLLLPRGEVPKAGLEYVRKLREVKYRQTLFEILARQVELAKLDEAKEGATIQVVDPALAPDHKSSPHRVLIIFLALVIGLLIAMLTAATLAGLERLERDPAKGEKVRSLRVLLRG